MHKQLAEQPPPEQDWSNYTDMPVGQILSRTRQYYGLTLADVESALRIRAIQLSALEEGNIDQLPGRVYAIGFVRAYAEFLGLDGDKIVYLFKSQLVGNKPKPELSLPVSASESKLPNQYILGGSLLGLVLMVGLYMFITPKTEKAEIPAVPAIIQKELVAFGPPAPTAEMLATIAPASGTEEPETRITINALDNAWVEIRNSEGKAILSRILKNGDSYLVPNEEGLVMDTGNVGVLEILVDGTVIKPLGEAGDVRRAVALDPDKLAGIEEVSEDVAPQNELDAEVMINDSGLE